MNVRVCKFGGSSLADVLQIGKALDIVLEDSTRKYVVVSAPGSRFKGDPKVTDLLCEIADKGRTDCLEAVDARMAQIAINADLRGVLSEELRRRMAHTGSDRRAQIVAFGEYANAFMVNAMLQNRGISSRVILPEQAGLKIRQDGMPNANSYPSMKRSLLDGFNGITIFPGFYGTDNHGRILTFPRGGSDISQGCVGRAVRASVCENWTDEDGLKRANPVIVPHAETIPEITYLEAMELTYAGFKLQNYCFAPLMGTGIQMRVLNTNNPKHPGTVIKDHREIGKRERIVGVAKQDRLISINLRKPYVEPQVGFGAKLLRTLAKMDVPYEHHPSGVGVMSIVVDKQRIGSNSIRDIKYNIKRACSPDRIQHSRFSLVSVAGFGMAKHYDTKTRIFGALARVRIKDRMIDDGAEDVSLFIGVDADRADDAVRAIYNEFYSKK
jgi:aspartate kinase